MILMTILLGVALWLGVAVVLSLAIGRSFGARSRVAPQQLIVPAVSLEREMAA